MPPDSGPAVRPLVFWLSGRWWRRDAHGTKVFPCSTCSGSIRETVDMVCQSCGTDYGVTRKLRAVQEDPDGT